MRPISFCMVKMSSSAWVGCSPTPSPALITGLRENLAAICATTNKRLHYRQPEAASLLQVAFRLYKHYIDHNQTLLTLMFRSLSDLHQKKLLPVLATVVTWRGKKSVIRVAQCIAALVLVHRTPSLLSDVHCFLNPSGTSIRLPIQVRVSENNYKMRLEGGTGSV